MKRVTQAAESSHVWAGADVPMHVDLTAVSPHGAVFHSLTTKTIILRFRLADDLPAMLALAELALKEAESLRGDLLLCDLRPLGTAAARLTCSAVMLHLLRCGTVACMALLTEDAEHQPVTSEVHDAITQSGAAWCFEQSFEPVAAWFSEKSEDMRIWLSARPKDFEASYAGSTYSLPELKCTVLRSSGNITERELGEVLLAKAYTIHDATQCDAFIFDSSASPPITDVDRYSRAVQMVVLPICTSGRVSCWLHVRSGDNMVEHEAPPMEPFFRSFNVEYIKCESMGEALKVLTSLRDRTPD